jgi:hypothetical protein
MRWFAVAVCALVLVYALGFLMIETGVDHTARQAMARFPGDPVAALIAQAGCQSCALPERNHAIWALGQLRDRRALPLLRQYGSGTPCDQREIRKAIRAIETPRGAIWLGYRGLISSL